MYKNFLQIRLPCTFSCMCYSEVLSTNARLIYTLGNIWHIQELSEGNVNNAL
jgi:hypothetical protein